jgi:hypothetical protein
VCERITGYIGVGAPSKLGLTNWEWVMIGEEASQWQMGGGFFLLPMDCQPHLLLAHFFTYCHPFPIGQPEFTWSANSYITCYLSMHSLFIITQMMEAVHTSETSVNFNVTTWCYIPEDSKLHGNALFVCSSSL